MTDQEIIRAIAGDLGWKCSITESQILGLRKTEWIRPGDTEPHGFVPPRWLDDHTSSHELIEVLRLDAWRFKWQLWPNSEDNHVTATRGKESITVIATTFSRGVAELFLRVRRKWQEEKETKP